MTHRPFSAFVVAALATLPACHNVAAGPESVAVTVRNAQGVEVGVLTLATATDGVHILGRLHDLPPGVHGIHFHQTSRCDAADFASAGAHVNPAQRRHGLASADGPHAGDLPNIEVSSAGTAAVEIVTTRVTLDASAATGLLDADGSALVVHAGADDQRTDPSGGSGARIACGTIAPR